MANKEGHLTLAFNGECSVYGNELSRSDYFKEVELSEADCNCNCFVFSHVKVCPVLTSIISARTVQRNLNDIHSWSNTGKYSKWSKRGSCFICGVMARSHRTLALLLSDGVFYVFMGLFTQSVSDNPNAAK